MDCHEYKRDIVNRLYNLKTSAVQIKILLQFRIQSIFNSAKRKQY